MCPSYEEEIHDYKNLLTRESLGKANEFDIPGVGLGHNDQRDAFRHAYSSALVTHDYGSPVAYAAGFYNEWEGNHSAHPQPVGEDHMDTFNNAVGRNIGSSAASRDDIAPNAYDAFAHGKLILDPGDEVPELPFENDRLYTPPFDLYDPNADNLPFSQNVAQGDENILFFDGGDDIFFDVFAGFFDD